LEITTDRLILRPISAADFEAHSRIVGDAAVMHYIIDEPMSRAQAWWNIARYLGHWQIRGYGMYVAIEKSSGDVIGHMGFLNAEGGRGFELGWILAPAAWGKGYASEGTCALVDHAFNTLGQTHIVCVINRENVRSIAVARRLGAKLEREELEGSRWLSIYGISRPSAQRQ
jgi:RimJ/RimL family protein N-acetyltransferase